MPPNGHASAPATGGTTSWSLPAAARAQFNTAAQSAWQHLNSLVPAKRAKKRAGTHASPSSSGGTAAPEDEARVVAGPHLQEVAEHWWSELGLDEDAAEALAETLTLNNAAVAADGEEEGDGEERDVVVADLTWGDLRAQMLELYTSMERDRYQSDCLGAARKLLLAGPAITASNRTEAIKQLRQCVAADAKSEDGAGSVTVTSHSLQARLLLARQLHSYSLSSRDLSEAQALLVRVMALSEELLEESEGDEAEQSDDEDEEEEGVRKVARRCREDAQNLLALMLCQAGREQHAAMVIGSMSDGSVRYRLSHQILCYTLPPPPITPTDPQPKGLVHAFDDVCPQPLLTALQAALQPTSDFWTQHHYQPDGSTPYFSYVRTLPEVHSQPDAEAPGNDHNNNSRETLLDQAVVLLQRVAARAFPEVKGARFAEWWAHCRPHAHGHQMHFDSDNEGVGEVRNPIVSMVLYLSEGVGGPTLVTPQPFGSNQLPDKGWLVHPKLNRLTVFKGNVLHGVVPGRDVVPASTNPNNSSETDLPFRVTLMVALWDDIRVRTYKKGQFGAAMPFPSVGDSVSPAAATTTTAAAATDATDGKTKGQGKAKGKAASRHPQPQTATWAPLFSPLPSTAASELAHVNVTDLPAATVSAVSAIWSDVDAAANEAEGRSLTQLAAAGKLPEYDACFQGF